MGATDGTVGAMQERIEASPAGRTLLSAGLVVFLFVSVVWNMPQSELQRRTVNAVRAPMFFAGLDQAWGVFAPDPPRIVLLFEARLVYPDGTQRTWRPPQGREGLGVYSSYRWQKYKESLTQDAHRELWEPFAAWLGRTQTVNGRRPVTISLVRRWHDMAQPGTRQGRPPFREYTFLTYRVRS